MKIIFELVFTIATAVMGLALWSGFPKNDFGLISVPTIAQSKTPDEAAKLLKCHRSEPNAGVISDKSLMLFDAWEQLKRSSHQSTTGDEIARFVGACESILGGEAPQTWIDAAYKRTDKTWRSFGRLSGIAYADIGSGFRSRNPGIMIHNKSIILYAANEKKIEISLADLNVPNSESVDYITDKGPTVVIAFPSLGSSPYKLICWRNGLLVWEAKVWSSGLAATTGPSHHYVDIRLTNDCVVVYGSDSYSLYVEAFSIKTGLPIVRFNSRGWDLGD